MIKDPDRTPFGYGRAMRAWIVAGLLSSSVIARAGELTGDVLVWDDATFYVEADDATHLTLMQFDRSKPEKLVGHVVPMKVVGHHGDFLEVEAIADGQCVGSTLEAQDVAQLRLFVKEDALAPVLVTPWTKQFDDGSRVALGAGEPVVPQDGGGVEFRIDDVVVDADVPAASIGRAYRAITPAALVPDHPRFQLHAGASAKLAGQTYTVTAKDDVVHAAHAIEHPHKDVSRFPIRTRCGELDVIVADDAVEPYQARKDRRIPRFGNGGYVIPKGTALSTRSGRRAGVTTRDIPVEQPTTGAKLACFDAPVAIDTPRDLPTDYDLQDDAKLELCAPVSAVQDVE